MTNPTEAPMANAIDDVKGEPDYFAVHSVTGSHIGLWKDETFARNVLKEYVGGTITPLYRASPAPSQHTGWSDEADTDRMQKISEVIAHLQSIQDRFGDTCVYTRRGGMSWGAVALNRRDDDKKNGVFDLQAQHDLDMTARLQQVQRLINDNRELRTALSAVSSIAPATGFEVKARRAVANYYERGGNHSMATEITRDDWKSGASQSEIDLVAAITATFSGFSMAPAEFEVNELQWSLNHGQAAETPFGLYEVEPHASVWHMLHSGGHLSSHPSEAEAKSAAQADFDRRIRSSISPSVAKESGEPVARPSYEQIINLVEDCRVRRDKAGESSRMMSKWISEGLNALFAHPLPNPSPSDGEVSEADIEAAAKNIYDEGPSIGGDCECGWAEQTSQYKQKARMVARAALQSKRGQP